MLEFIFPILKWWGIAALIYIWYLVYQILISPYLCWKRFQKYENVYTSPDFVPILGDFKKPLDDFKEGRVHYYHKIKNAPTVKDYDLMLKIEGFFPIIALMSNKAVEEFWKLQPHKIDRSSREQGIAKMGKDTFIFEKSTKNTIARKKLLTGFLSLNSSSRHIPIMVKHTKEVIDKIEDGSTTDFIEVTNIISFNIFTSVLFGSDMLSIAEKKRPYKMPDGTVDHLNLRGFIIRLFKAYHAQVFHPFAIIAKFLMKYDLVNPFRRDRENYLVIMEAMKELFSNCKEEGSICRQIFKSTETTEFEKINDLTAFILAGAETSSHAIASTLFYLKKFPKKLQKLLKELEDNGITKEYIDMQPLIRETIESLDYLSWVVKETLRVDNPASESFGYSTAEDVIIWGVPLPKGTHIKEEIYSAHYNENYWKDPYEFVPERFDVESDFFKEAKKEKKSGGGYSKRGFSHGTRACPGQSFALLEIKVALIVILTHIDYTVDEELFQKEGVGFGVGSKCIPFFGITKL